jgi:hypothetical protein
VSFKSQFQIRHKIVKKIKRQKSFKLTSKFWSLGLKKKKRETFKAKSMNQSGIMINKPSAAQVGNGIRHQVRLAPLKTGRDNKNLMQRKEGQITHIQRRGF